MVADERLEMLPQGGKIVCTAYQSRRWTLEIRLILGRLASLG
jgi:hypothetical protein